MDGSNEEITIHDRSSHQQSRRNPHHPLRDRAAGPPGRRRSRGLSDDETMILSATSASKRPKDQLDFFPLTVDVEERMYSIGKIPGSFFRREGRPAKTPS